MGKAQVIKCKCGKVFAACREPECYTEKDWMKDMRKYVIDGCTVDMVNTNEFQFENCVCDKSASVKIGLFADESK